VRVVSLGRIRSAIYFETVIREQPLQQWKRKVISVSGRIQCEPITLKESGLVARGIGYLNDQGPAWLEQPFRLSSSLAVRSRAQARTKE
jgi:hypothetical protein